MGAPGGGPRFTGATSQAGVRTRAVPGQQYAAPPAASGFVAGKGARIAPRNAIMRAGLRDVPDDIKGLWLLVGLEVAFLVWHRKFFKAAHGG